MLARTPRVVLFDLDGTLIDSAPDLVAAVQALCRELGAPEPDADGVRRVVSAGGRAMLRQGLPGADDAMIDQWLPRFLDLYSVAMTRHTCLYPGIVESLAALAAHDITWGIVTNKPGWLARPLLAQLPLLAASRVLVAGDTLPLRKPDPAPVLHACAALGIAPAQAVMIGDDLRDVQAGRAAGTTTLVAGWGYLDGEPPERWGADGTVATPLDLPRALGLRS
ncbi:MAG: HAD family hydrolase [Xanthomonadales bacterium]|nr:HAD family hydrolase [Xanthomonadales bacterium]MCC6596224.1 HAD-IA family hydrolase [Rhodanobacteraceae bacterium]MDL1869448.1 HAD family hydrolase [Gammaproteobacteria bacterium PRO6]